MLCVTPCASARSSGNASPGPPPSTRTALCRCSTAITSKPSIRAASRARAPARTSLCTPARCVACATASVPREARTAPSNASSPNSTTRSRPSGASCPLAPSTAHASARSSPGPAFLTSPGARFATMRLAGNSYPELRIAALMRSRASRTAASARPTIAKPGRPRRTSTSTVTRRACRPSIVNVCARASIAAPPLAVVGKRGGGS